MDTLLTGVLALVGGGIGSYLGSYLKKKGENLAIREDLDNLVDQVKVVTQTTKEIEAKISRDVWDSQKRWEMKREVLFEAAKRMVELDNGLIRLDSLRKVEDPDADHWIEHKSKALTEWRDTLRRLDETQTLITVVCGKETVIEFHKFAAMMHEFGAQLASGDTQQYREQRSEMSTQIVRIRFIIRKELGIDGVG